MIKYIILITALTGCLENPFEQHCNDPGKPAYPAIGGCIQGAAQGSPGGTCFPGIYGSGDTCDGTLQCIYGTCYECGKGGEACCGDIAQGGQGGTCLDGQGVCAVNNAEEWYTCQGAAAPIPPDCSGGGPIYYVSYTTADCGAVTSAQFCAADDGTAQAWVDANLGGVPHGTPSQNSAVAGAQVQVKYACGQGVDCISGGGDGSLPSTFYVVGPDLDAALTACEAQREPATECTSWITSDNQSCPAM